MHNYLDFYIKKINFLKHINSIYCKLLPEILSILRRIADVFYHSCGFLE